MISIGDLNEYITIQKATITTDSMGGQRLSWLDYVSTYAKIEWKEGSSDESNNKIDSDMQIEVTVRNIGANLQQVSGRQSFRIKYPADTGTEDTAVGYWNVNGIKLHGGQYNRYKTMYCSTTSIDNHIIL